ncbi:MAG: hypothetical protein ACKOXB_13220 [Flavobacteriales bacterium]
MNKLKEAMIFAFAPNIVNTSSPILTSNCHCEIFVPKNEATSFKAAIAFVAGYRVHLIQRRCGFGNCSERGISLGNSGEERIEVR